jgi:hypothetical protein
MPIGEGNWSVKVSVGWPEDPEDPEEDVAGPAWAGVRPMTVTYGEPMSAPDLTARIGVPDSIRAMIERSVE